MKRLTMTGSVHKLIFFLLHTVVEGRDLAAKDKTGILIWKIII
jgi:hypothetical protein